MNLHLYIVFDLTRINEDGEHPMDVCRVLTDKTLRDEFLWAYNNGRIPHELIDDYKGDPDYKTENWDDMGNLRIGTMIDMLNDIANYECGTGYYITETDVEVELNRKMLDEWLDVLNYFDSDIADVAERENKMVWYHKYEKVQDEIYRMIKGV